MQKTRLAAGLRPDPLGELTALPQSQTLQLDLKGPTSEGGKGKKKEAEREGGKGERRGNGREEGKGRRN